MRDHLRYSQIIGSLMYLANATRPDISFAMNKLSQFISNPGDDHWKALERVMRYLQWTMKFTTPVPQGTRRVTMEFTTLGPQGTRRV